MAIAAKQQTSENTLKFEHLDAPLGIVVQGINWDEPAADEVRLLNQALRRHLLVVFRGQPSPSRDQLDKFFGRFGNILLKTFDGSFHYNTFSHDQKMEIHRRDDGNYIMNTTAGTSELVWHQDQFHRPQLKKISVLEAIDFQEGAAPTYFRDVYTAYELLPPELRYRLENKQAVALDPKLPSPTEMPRLGDAMHPVFTPHPDSGRRALCINEYTWRIAGMQQTESDKLIKELLEFIELNAPFYAHQWKSGDLVAWDNVGLQHRRPSSGPEYRRAMRVYEGIAE